jgi:trk system potassium uptake protein TrkH
VLVLFRTLKAELKRFAHPRAVVPVRLVDETIGSEKLQQVTVFVFAYVTLFLLGTVALLALEPVSVLDGALAVAASIGNIGPALGQFSPIAGYASLSTPSSILLALLMWLGRLELFAVLVVFSPETYR